MAKDVRAVQFGQRLRELREAKGLSRKKLADIAGLSERAIIKWELGEREPGWFNILALCKGLGVDCTAFNPEPQPATRPKRKRK
ncbi:MAG TPA: helix-turn-helix transcriptional regulator [Gemmataceae bacterium]|jgi:transcriptional regulator with XRE-family HTH domain